MAFRGDSVCGAADLQHDRTIESAPLRLEGSNLGERGEARLTVGLRERAETFRNIVACGREVMGDISCLRARTVARAEERELRWKVGQRSRSARFGADDVAVDREIGGGRSLQLSGHLRVGVRCFRLQL